MCRKMQGGLPLGKMEIKVARSLKGIDRMGSPRDKIGKVKKK